MIQCLCVGFLEIKKSRFWQWFDSMSASISSSHFFLNNANWKDKMINTYLKNVFHVQGEEYCLYKIWEIL